MKLKFLDGLSIETTEIQKANEAFSGWLTDEILESYAPNMNFTLMKELDISSWKLRDFNDLFNEGKFPNLRELILSNYNLITLKGFSYLPKLKFLTISTNKLETLISSLSNDGYPKGLLGLTGLEDLDISYNITYLYGLNFAPMNDLKTLNVSNNITKLEQIDHLKDLRKIDLSNNRIIQFYDSSFYSIQQISWLRIKENGVRSLNYIDKLENLKFLFFHLIGNLIFEISRD